MVFSISIVFFLLINLFFIIKNEKVYAYWHKFAPDKLQKAYAVFKEVKEIYLNNGN